MEILLTGGTGLIGRNVLARLVARGHEVTAVVRSDASADVVRAAGAVPVVGDLTDRGWFGGQLETVQGAIHTAAGSDADDAAMNDAVIDAVLDTYGGSDKPFVLTGGVWTYGDGDDVTEASPSAPPAITSWRVAGERRLLDSDVRASVIQPGIVYGQGGGIPNLLVAGPRSDDGTLRLIGSGDQHWTTIHVDDLADLYVVVLETAPGGSAYIAVSGDNPTVAELGAAIAPAVTPGSPEDAAARFGDLFAEALLLDQQATGAHARSLGWTPSAPSLVAELAGGYSAPA